MLVGRVLEVGAGGPVAGLQAFLQGLLHASGAAGLLAPVELAAGRAEPQWLPAGADFARINPLVPKVDPGAVDAVRSGVPEPGWRSAVAVLRPCEVRAVSALARKRALDPERLIVVGMDCLPAAWWVDLGEASDDPEGLAEVQSARSGPGCEWCDRPGADYREADVLVGPAARGERLLILADQERDSLWGLEALTTRPATEREIADREVMLWRLADRRRQAATARVEGYGLKGSSRGRILELMQACTHCDAACIDTCHEWADELRAARAAEHPAFASALWRATERLRNCALCGVCQIGCSEGIPLHAIRWAMRQRPGSRLSAWRSADLPMSKTA